VSCWCLDTTLASKETALPWHSHSMIYHYHMASLLLYQLALNITITVLFTPYSLDTHDKLKKRKKGKKSNLEANLLLPFV
jgi:hypothetical protein